MGLLAYPLGRARPKTTITNSGFLVWRDAVPAPHSYGPVPWHIDVKHKRLDQIKTPEPICKALRSFLLGPISGYLLLLQIVVFPTSQRVPIWVPYGPATASNLAPTCG